MQNHLLLLLTALFLFGCGDDDDNGSEAMNGTLDSGAGGGAGGGAGEPTGGSTGGGDDTCGTVHTVTTTDDRSDVELYMDFTPEDLTISVGDCVNFVMSDTHNAIEVSQGTYDSRGAAPLDGGFEVTFGETKEIKFDSAGVHYYVCQPHARMDMIGTITVE